MLRRIVYVSMVIAVFCGLTEGEFQKLFFKFNMTQHDQD